MLNSDGFSAYHYFNKKKDTHAERDYLIEKIYPELKTYCKKEYGLNFQVCLFFKRYILIDKTM
jgi:hypothetical protein